MRFLVNNIHHLSIDDTYVDYSPFLKSMRDTLLITQDDQGRYLLDIELKSFIQYLHFLEGEEFYMDEEVANIFDYMGHINAMGYPIDYWKVKLQDIWIRDNMYKLSLWKDPYYGLIQIPIINHIDFLLNENLYIAGGTALWMAGYTKFFKDVDIFTTDVESVRDLVKRTSTPSPWKLQGNCINQSMPAKRYIGDKLPMTNPSSFRYLKLQVILRLYKAPTEIIHGFDLDNVGIIYDGSSLWCTKRAYYSITNMINWVDPERASPSYVSRLIKYKRRGFDIGLPLITGDTINLAYMDKIFDQLSKIDIYVGRPDDKKVSIRFNTNDIPVPISTLATLKEYRLNMLRIRPYQLIIATLQDSHRDVYREILPLDPPSRLIMAQEYEIYLELSNITDYEIPDDTFASVDPEFISDLPWKVQDPMTQLSGTFQPEPIIDIVEWYKESPLVNT